MQCTIVAGVKRYHRSIMVKEVVEILQIKAGTAVADLTFGEGGHTEAFVEAGASLVYASDRDADAVENYRLSGPLAADPRLQLRWGNASDFSTTFPEVAPGSLDAAFLDLGVSTWQVLDPARGFSFSYPGPLDMRMDRNRGEILPERLRNATLTELVHAFENADIYPAEPLARDVLDAARRGQLVSTADLAVLVQGKGKRHPATQLFLALRMWLNDELGEVERVLPLILDKLKVGGRLAVLSFHSTEDRLVKRAFQGFAGRCACREPICTCTREKQAEWVLKKALPPTREEMGQNSRSRSAKLRCVEKCERSV